MTQFGFTYREATACEVMWDRGCKAWPGFVDSNTKAKCFACGCAVCTGCSRIRDYLRYGRRRLCMKCIEERAEDMKRYRAKKGHVGRTK